MFSTFNTMASVLSKSSGSQQVIALVNNTTLNPTSETVNSQVYKVYKFTDTTATNTIQFIPNGIPFTVSLFMVGGGGHGGSNSSGGTAGGGGGGGVLEIPGNYTNAITTPITINSTTTFTVSIGPGNQSTVFSNGTITYTAGGGGRGASNRYSSLSGSNGGSGGGSGGGGSTQGYTSGAAASDSLAGSPNQNKAGASCGTSGNSGGGGGAGSVGSVPNGGAGVKPFNLYFGTSYYGGGGGGGRGGSGGIGGGGTGASSTNNAVAGQPNTGGGGGGSADSRNNSEGGSGICMIAVKIT
jgi:hypothetical protein